MRKFRENMTNKKHAILNYAGAVMFLLCCLLNMQGGETYITVIFAAMVVVDIIEGIRYTKKWMDEKKFPAKKKK